MSVTEVPTPSHSAYNREQHRFGTAPLASFEDLPTDDQNSSSEDEKRNSIVNNNNKSSDIVFIVTDYDRNVINLDPIQTPQNAAINFSHYTESKRKSSWTDFFSLRKSPTPTKSKERKFSLFNFNFFTKEENRTDDQKDSVKFEKLVVVGDSCCHSSDTNSIDHEKSEIVCEQQEQLTDEHDKANEPIQILHSIGQNEIESVVTSSQTNISIEVQFSDTTLENDKELNSLKSASSYLVDAECCMESSVNGNYYKDNVIVDGAEYCCETDLECADCVNCISPSTELECGCSLNDTDAAAVADNEDNTEVDSASQSNVVSFDGELDLLLKGDELDLNNCSTDELYLKPIAATNYTSNSNKLNLKLSIDTIKTSPIDRPRSATPINVDSFEAYINGFESTNLGVSNCDKLTITLPGSQFNPRNKLTRKSNPYIWQEFCEKGLKSPQMLRKRANSCFPEINQNFFFNDAFESPENLTPITPIKDLERETGQCRFDDNFWDYSVMAASEANQANEFGNCTKSGKNKVSINNLKGFEMNCSCECNSSITSSAVNNLISQATCSEASSFSEASDDDKANTNTNQSIHRAKSSEYHDDQPLVSPCDCACHLQPLMADPNHTNFNNADHQFDLNNTCGGNSKVSILKAAFSYTEDSLSCTLSPDSSSTLSSSTSQSSTCSTSAQLIDCSTGSNNSDNNFDKSMSNKPKMF